MRQKDRASGLRRLHHPSRDESGQPMRRRLFSLRCLLIAAIPGESYRWRSAVVDRELRRLGF